jgi:hypothetical protein
VAVALLLGIGTVAAWGRDPGPDQIGTTSPDTAIGTTESVAADSTTSLDPASTIANTSATTSATTVTTIASSPTDPLAPSTPSAVSTTPSVAPTAPATLPPTSSPAPTTTTSTGPVTQSFTCTGGSISVRLQAGQLQLISTSPAAGFAVDEQDVQATEVEVRFQSTTHRSKVSVHVVGDAMQQQPCDERDEVESDEGGDGASSASTSSTPDDD